MGLKPQGKLHRGRSKDLGIGPSVPSLSSMGTRALSDAGVPVAFPCFMLTFQPSRQLLQVEQSKC